VCGQKCSFPFFSQGALANDEGDAKVDSLLLRQRHKGRVKNDLGERRKHEHAVVCEFGHPEQCRKHETIYGLFR
jgi:hypothetical protein